MGDVMCVLSRCASAYNFIMFGMFCDKTVSILVVGGGGGALTYAEG